MAELADAFGWRLQGEAVDFDGVAIDNRRIAGGELFVALRGERFDGHAFTADALARGAAGAVVERNLTVAGPLLICDDTLVALGQIAARHRQQWPGKLLAVTGSAGKTTTKEMLSAICARLAPVHATAGNLNNEIGVPLTLLGLRPEHRYAVVEMGAAKPGDIAYLAALARPDVSMLTNAMPAHLQGFGSVEQVAATKAEIFVADAGHAAVINLDDPFAPSWLRRAGPARVFGFSVKGARAAAVRAERIEQRADGSDFVLVSPAGRCAIRLRVPGVHNIANALAAAAAALAVDVPLEDVSQGLEGFSGVAGRMQFRPGGGGLLVIDDSYNANPRAVRAAIDVLARQPGRRALLLGDMGELGESAGALHRELGDYARQCGIDRLLAVGELASQAAASFGVGGRAFESRQALRQWLAGGELAGDCACVLVKGSRSARMEEFVSCLVDGAVSGADSPGGEQ